MINKKKLWAMVDILLAHHPNCGKFEDHVIHIGKIRLCAGCTFFSIGFISSLIAFSYLYTKWFNGWVYMFFGGLLLFFAYLVAKYWYKKWNNRLAKLLSGFGFNFYFFGGAKTVLGPLVVFSIPIGMFFYAKEMKKQHEKICASCKTCTWVLNKKSSHK